MMVFYLSLDRAFTDLGIHDEFMSQYEWDYLEMIAKEIDKEIRERAAFFGEDPGIPNITPRRMAELIAAPALYHEMLFYYFFETNEPDMSGFQDYFDEMLEFFMESFDMYKQFFYEIDIKAVFLDTIEEAEELHARITGGEISFDEAVEAYSIFFNAVEGVEVYPLTGTITLLFSWYSFMWDLESDDIEEIAALPVGSVTRAYELYDFSVILQVVDKDIMSDLEIEAALTSDVYNYAFEIYQDNMEQIMMMDFQNWINSFVLSSDFTVNQRALDRLNRN
jgi:hypothetical protein